jgi:hypothetical protein
MPDLETQIHNERVKFTAGFLDRFATASLTVGLATPVAAQVFGATSVTVGWKYGVACLMFGVVGVAMHAVGRKQLGRLR